MLEIKEYVRELKGRINSSKEYTEGETALNSHKNFLSDLYEKVNLEQWVTVWGELRGALLSFDAAMTSVVAASSPEQREQNKSNAQAQQDALLFSFDRFARDILKDGKLVEGFTIEKFLVVEFIQHALKARSGKVHDLIEEVNSGTQPDQGYESLVKEMESLAEYQGHLITKTS